MGYLATIAGRSRPTLRPVSFFLAGRKICFCTGADNPKINQISHNPRVEVCLPVKRGKWTGYYRVAGTAEIVKEKKDVRRIYGQIPYRKEQYWDGPDDPRLAVVVISPENSRYFRPGKLAEADVRL